MQTAAYTKTLTLRVAQHPSESADYLLTRLLAYCLEYTEGIAFSKGLSNPEEPAIAVRDLTGALQTWIDIGTPAGDRLHKAARPHGAWSSTYTETLSLGCCAWTVSAFTERRLWRSMPWTGSFWPPGWRASSGEWSSICLFPNATFTCPSGMQTLSGAIQAPTEAMRRA